MRKKRRRFSQEYKLEVVEMVVHGGQAIQDLARDLDLRPDMIQRWVKKYESAGSQAFPGKGRPANRDDQLERLRRENRILREERAILKKVVAIFSEPQQ